MRCFSLGSKFLVGCLGNEMRCFSLGLELLVVVLTYSLLVAPFFLFKKILFYSSFISMYVSACMYVSMDTVPMGSNKGWW